MAHFGKWLQGSRFLEVINWRQTNLIDLIGILTRLAAHMADYYIKNPKL